MQHVAEWTARVYLFEKDGSTQARVELQTGSNLLIGVGSARCNPTDADVPEIGDELAVGRALVNLGEQLLRAAADDTRALA